MSTISKSSGRFRVLFQIAFYIVPFITVGFWILAKDYPGIINMDFRIPVDVHEMVLNPRSQFLAIIVSAIPTAVMMYGLHTLQKLFRHYENGEIFSMNNVKCYRALAYTLFAWVGCRILWIPLITAALTFQNPPGHRMVALNIGLFDIEGFIIGAVILLIAKIMAEGYHLAEDQMYTV